MDTTDTLNTGSLCMMPTVYLVGYYGFSRRLVSVDRGFAVVETEQLGGDGVAVRSTVPVSSLRASREDAQLAWSMRPRRAKCA